MRLTANDMLDDSYARSTKNPAFMAKLASRNVLRDTDDFDAEVHEYGPLFAPRLLLVATPSIG